MHGQSETCPFIVLWFEFLVYLTGICLGSTITLTMKTESVALGNSRPMDSINASDPQPRIIATSSKALSTKRAQLHLQAFLDEFETRNPPNKGGDKTVTAQLQKLNKALLEERLREKATRKEH